MGNKPIIRSNATEKVIRSLPVREPSPGHIEPGSAPRICRLFRAIFRSDDDPGETPLLGSSHAHPPALPPREDVIATNDRRATAADDLERAKRRLMARPASLRSRDSSIGPKNISTAQATLNTCRLEAYHRGLGRLRGFPVISTSGRLLEIRTLARKNIRPPKERERKYKPSPLGLGVPKQTEKSEAKNTRARSI